MGETKRQDKIRRGKTCKCMLLFLLHFELVLHGALLTGCKADALPFPASVVLFLPMISMLSPGWCCCLSKCTVTQAGEDGRAESHWVVAPELLGQFFFEQPVSTNMGFTLLFAVERFWILLKAFPNQPPTCLLYFHSLWLVLKHLVFALQRMSFLRALMHLSSQINVTERKSYKLPWTDSRLLNPRPAIKSFQCLVVSSLFFRSFIIYSMCLAVWYFITAGGGWQTQSQESVSSLASETLQNLRLLGANPMLF